MKYNVHLFATVRLKIDNIDAEDQKEAIKKAINGTDLNLILNRSTSFDGCSCVEWEDEITQAIVDEVGDLDHENTMFWKPKGVQDWEKV